MDRREFKELTNKALDKCGRICLTGRFLIVGDCYPTDSSTTVVLEYSTIRVPAWRLHHAHQYTLQLLQLNRPNCAAILCVISHRIVVRGQSRHNQRPNLLGIEIGVQLVFRA